MRILTVSAFFESHGGGIEIVAGALARALADLGHESRITGAAFDPPPSDGSAAPVPIPCRDPVENLLGLPLPLPGLAGRSILYDEVRAADAIVIHDALYASSILAARWARRLRKPWLIVQHIGDIPYSSAVLRGLLVLANSLATRPLLARAPQAVFISDAVRGHFADLPFRRPPELMFNGVDSSMFRFADDDEAAGLKRDLGWSSGCRQLLFVGRFVEKKGLAALRAFAAARPDIDLRMVGGGPIDPADWRLPNVHVLGRKTRSELARLYRACDALVLPSVGEGYPLVVQEALASGLPVFCGLDSAAADPAAARFLQAFEVRPDNPALTARRLSEALDRAPAERSPAAAAYAAAAYDWMANARSISGILQELRA